MALGKARNAAGETGQADRRATATGAAIAAATCGLGYIDAKYHISKDVANLREQKRIGKLVQQRGTCTPIDDQATTETSSSKLTLGLLHSQGKQTVALVLLRGTGTATQRRALSVVPLAAPRSRREIHLGTDI